MPDYEIRIISPAGKTSLLYVANFATDDEAREQARNIARKHGRLEIWRGLEKILEIAPDEKS